ncbi:hypothetical protein M413DRAFT_442465 [Hebeloma cylindrosporum]|uniref:Uncharacterized protein n=1 Tax=Hebeloma cylindrosporum TaxID=76867 RepID=A0A0C2YTY5_HEBCY|nr:hypothetical protein M413DRAFT_442465 [Hebeloma cylindrosporum h7]
MAAADDLLAELRSTHAQAIAVQCIAQELGWCDAPVTPFLPQQVESRDFTEMIEKGVKVNKLPIYLLKAPLTAGVLVCPTLFILQFVASY